MTSFKVIRENESFASVNAKCDEKKITRKNIVRKHGDLVRMTQIEGKEKFSYKFGDKYPGLIVGHEKCKDKDGNCIVPKYMGWLWNIETLGIKKVRKGWCPGKLIFFEFSKQYEYFHKYNSIVLLSHSF